MGNSRVVCYNFLTLFAGTMILIQASPVAKQNKDDHKSVIEHPDESTSNPDITSTESYIDDNYTPDSIDTEILIPDLNVAASSDYAHKHHGSSSHDHHGYNYYHDQPHKHNGHAVVISGPHDDSHHYVTQFGSPYMSYTGPGSYYTGTGTGTATGTGYPTAYGIATGYNGIYAPTSHSHYKKSPLSYLISLMPTAIAGWMFKTLAVAVSILGVVFFGGAIATALCTLTPLCSLSFRGINLFKLKETAESVGKIIKDEVTPERIRRATAFAQLAIEKYSKLQQIAGKTTQE